MKKTKSAGIFLAILAASLYAINSPLSKILLDYMPPTLMAGFLYVGAGVGMVVIAVIRKLVGSESRESSLTRAELPYYTYFIALALMIIGAWLSASDKPLFRRREEKK